MKKNLLLIIFFLVLFQQTLFAQNFTQKKERLVIESPQALLKSGEYLRYSAEWLGIPAGIVTLRVSGIEKFKGRDCYHIIGRAVPNKFFASFYDVEYIVHSYIDVESKQPSRFQKIRRRKDAINDTTIDFDWGKNKATFTSKGSDVGLEISNLRDKINKDIPISDNITKDTQDLLSSIYFFRLLKIEGDHAYSFNIYYAQRVWPILVNVGAPYLRDFRKLGTFRVFKVSVGSIITDFILGKHNFGIYFTADFLRIPLEFEVGTAIGYIRCRLQKLPE